MRAAGISKIEGNKEKTISNKIHNANIKTEKYPRGQKEKGENQNRAIFYSEKGAGIKHNVKQGNNFRVDSGDIFFAGSDQNIIVESVQLSKGKLITITIPTPNSKGANGDLAGDLHVELWS